MQAGNDAFQDLWRREFEPLVRRLCVMTRHLEDAEDAAQEAMARAHAYGIDRIENPAAWLFVVGRNAAVSARRAVRETSSLDAVPEIAGPTFDREEGVDLAVARARLTDRQQAMLTLRYDIGLSSLEIAAILGVADGTVRATLHQSLRRLRLVLGPIRGRDAVRGRR